MDAMCDRLKGMPDVTVIRRLEPSEKLQSAGVLPSCPQIAVVEAATHLPAMRTLHVHIEPDLPLSGAGPAATPSLGMLPLRDPGLVMPLEKPVQISLCVCGPNGEPLAGAGVFLIGSTWPAQGITACDGTVTVRGGGPRLVPYAGRVPRRCRSRAPELPARTLLKTSAAWANRSSLSRAFACAGEADGSAWAGGMWDGWVPVRGRGAYGCR
ncbi:hypothetical protein ACWET9_14000 [Streptomyces sp. NPDC004059]